MGWFSRERAEFRELLNEPSSRKPLITNRAKSRNRENCVGEKGVEYVRGLCRKHFRSKKENLYFNLFRECQGAKSFYQRPWFKEKHRCLEDEDGNQNENVSINYQQKQRTDRQMDRSSTYLFHEYQVSVRNVKKSFYDDNKKYSSIGTQSNFRSNVKTILLISLT